MGRGGDVLRGVRTCTSRGSSQKSPDDNHHHHRRGDSHAHGGASAEKKSGATTANLAGRLKWEKARECRGRDAKLLDESYLCAHSTLPTVGNGLPAGPECEKKWPLFFDRKRQKPLAGHTCTWGERVPRTLMRSLP